MNIDQITAAVVASYESKQPIMIWGPPGVGKSDALRAATDQLRGHFLHNVYKGRKAPDFELIDLRLSQLEPVDLRGMPFPSTPLGTGDRALGSRRTLEWITPSFLPTSGNGILFFDEYVQGALSTQNAASQLILDRRCGDYVLPAGWHVVAAGNRLKDRAATNAMPTQIANRFIHFYADVDVDSWIKWAFAKSIDIRVIAFIKWRRPLLHAFDPTLKGEAFPSPRSWAFVAKCLKQFQHDRALLEAMVKGAVGDGPGGEFIAFIDIWDKLPDIDAILLNPKTADVPTDPATLYAIIASLSHRATKDSMDAIVTYFTRLSDMGRPEFSVAAMKELTARDVSLTKTNAFIRWATAHNHLFV